MSRRRGRSSKRRGTSGKGKPFWADRLYAAWCALTACGLGGLAAVVSSLPEEFIAEGRNALKTVGLSQFDWRILAGLALTHFVFDLLVAIALWQSRRWGFWLILVQNAAVALAALLLARKGMPAEFSGLLTPVVYALVRLNGIWGPKPR